MKKESFGIRNLLPYLKKYRAELIGMLVTCALGSVIDIGVPLFQRYALDRFVAEQNLKTMPVFAAVYFAVILFAAAVNYISGIWGMKIEVGVDRDLRNAAFSHLQTLSFSYFNQNSVGYIHSRVMSDTQRIGELLSWTLLNGVWQLTYVIGAVAAGLAGHDDCARCNGAVRGVPEQALCREPPDPGAERPDHGRFQRRDHGRADGQNAGCGGEARTAV